MITSSSNKILPKKAFVGGRDENTTDVWLTPRYILQALGGFDLDPCAATDRPWDTAKNHYTAEDDGLSRPWVGRVWLNPPYGRTIGIWLERLARHGDGIALVAARTDAKWFHSLVWESADGILFFKGRLKFHKGDGQLAGSAGFPSCLAAYGASNAELLKDVAGGKLNGHYLGLRHDVLAALSA